jgi:hypothetical protein
LVVKIRLKRNSRSKRKLLKRCFSHRQINGDVSTIATFEQYRLENQGRLLPDELFLNEVQSRTDATFTWREGRCFAERPHLR